MKRNRKRTRCRPLASLLAVVITLSAVVALGASLAADKPSNRGADALTISPVDVTPLTVETITTTLTPTTAPERESAPPEEPSPEPLPSRYEGLEVTEDDIYTLACLVYHEARGEQLEGQVAVVEVVFNRMLSGYFPDTVEEVVFQKYGRVWQFSPAPYLYTAEPGETQYEAVYTALSETEYILTEETVFFSTEPYNEQISAIIGNHYFCEVEEAKQ